MFFSFVETEQFTQDELSSMILSNEINLSVNELVKYAIIKVIAWEIIKCLEKVEE